MLFISLDTTRADVLLDPKTRRPRTSMRCARARGGLGLRVHAGADDDPQPPDDVHRRQPLRPRGALELRPAAGAVLGPSPRKSATRGWRTLGIATLAVFRENTRIQHRLRGLRRALALPAPEIQGGGRRDGQAAAEHQLGRHPAAVPEGPAAELAWAMDLGLPIAATKRPRRRREHPRPGADLPRPTCRRSPTPYFYFLHISDPHTPYVPAPEVEPARSSIRRGSAEVLPDGVERVPQRDRADFLGGVDVDSPERAAEIGSPCCATCTARRW